MNLAVNSCIAQVRLGLTAYPQKGPKVLATFKNSISKICFTLGKKHGKC